MAKIHETAAHQLGMLLLSLWKGEQDHLPTGSPWCGGVDYVVKIILINTGAEEKPVPIVEILYERLLASVVVESSTEREWMVIRPPSGRGSE
jgi:hypothetical protein